MPVREVLLLAVTKMKGGACIAGMTTDPDAVTGLSWVRPTREHGHVLLGDITTPAGEVLRPFDVAELSLLRPRPEPPHAEDWATDFVRHRPRVVRRLEGQRRADFLRRYLDTAPREVLEGQQRSLCLIKPGWVKGCFRLDAYSGKYDARLAFGLQGRTYRGSYAKGGHSVTDLKWRALGRAWLPNDGGWTEFEAGDLEARLGIREVYLAVGLTRSYKGGFWLVVIGVHTVPDYEATIDYENL
jgi:hypothetical protein